MGSFDRNWIVPLVGFLFILGVVSFAATRFASAKHGESGSLSDVGYIEMKKLISLFDKVQIDETAKKSTFYGWWAKSDYSTNYVVSSTFVRENYFAISTEPTTSVTKITEDFGRPNKERLIFSNTLEPAGYIAANYRSIRLRDVTYSLNNDSRFPDDHDYLAFRLNPCDFQLIDFICIETFVKNHETLKTHGEANLVERGFIKFYVLNTDALLEGMLERDGYLLSCSSAEDIVSFVYAESLTPKSLIYERLRFENGKYETLEKHEIELADPEYFIRIYDYDHEKSRLLVGRYRGSWETLLPKKSYIELYDLKQNKRLGRRVMPSDASAGIFIYPEEFKHRQQGQLETFFD
ncbi:MAG: hypothetical protein AAF546_01720 [Verrucomicrobiota bacterium]